MDGGVGQVIPVFDFDDQPVEGIILDPEITPIDPLVIIREKSGILADPVRLEPVFGYNHRIFNGFDGDIHFALNHQAIAGHGRVISVCREIRS
jgi:hypothetical protein